MIDLDGKVAFVTGGAGGVGGALARQFLDAGMKVALADISAPRLQQAAARIGGNVATVVLDVTNEESWKSAVDEVEATLGPISVLVNAAGIGGKGAVGDESPARWKLIQEINSFGPFLGCYTLIPRMKARGTPAHIVNIASLAGLNATPTISAYNASKYAAVGLSDTLRGELAGSNIGLSVVYPGMIHTGFHANSSEVTQNSIGLGEPEDRAALLATGMPVEQAGAIIMQGIREGRYHIFTHGGWRKRLAATFDDRMAAYGDDGDYGWSDNLDEIDSKFGQ